MRLSRLIPPKQPPITLSDVKTHIRVEFEDDDTYIDGLIAAAVAFVDGTGLLGRSMVRQTWALWVKQCPGHVKLTMGPFLELKSVGYYDLEGAFQEAILSDFEVHLVDEFAIVKPKAGASWPQALERPDAIKITFDAGFGDVVDVPADLKQALFLLVGHWYQNREAVSDLTLKEIPLGVEALIGGHKIGWYG